MARFHHRVLGIVANGRRGPAVVRKRLWFIPSFSWILDILLYPLSFLQMS